MLVKKCEKREIIWKNANNTFAHPQAICDFSFSKSLKSTHF